MSLWWCQFSLNNQQFLVIRESEILSLLPCLWYLWWDTQSGQLGAFLWCLGAKLLFGLLAKIGTLFPRFQHYFYSFEPVDKYFNYSLSSQPWEKKGTIFQLLQMQLTKRSPSLFSFFHFYSCCLGSVSQNHSHHPRNLSLLFPTFYLSNFSKFLVYCPCWLHIRWVRS